MVDKSKRQAVRNVVSIAPIILTLRSGLVAGLPIAAESCVGVKTVNANVDRATGLITTHDTNIEVGDYCFGSMEVSQCPGNTPMITRNVGIGEPIQQDALGNFICPTQNLRTSRVAILSSASATSLMGG